MQLDPLVKPRSVAIVGATDRVGPARSVIESLGAIGFAGPIYPVNPKYQTVRNLVCYPTLTDLPEAPDVVVFSIRKPLLPEQVRLAVKRGARAAVIYDAGFAELGEDGARQQAEIADLCREAGMPVCGPNCMGILNPTARSTTYKQTVMDPSGLAGNVGIVSQSGSVCIAMLSDLRRFGISLSVSAGNEAVTRTVDYLEYLIDDPATKVIATFTETVREPERYVAALDRAAAAGKPVVVLKVGRAERTQRAITSHTGGLAGSSRVFSEVLRAHRAIEVTDLDKMTEVLAVCQGARWPRGRRISVVTGSGSLTEMMLDNATAAGLDLPPLSPAERSEAEREIGGTRQGLGAIDRVGRYMTAPKPPRSSARRPPPSQLAELLAAKPGRRTINEHDAKRLLAGFGLPVTREHRVATLEAATEAARELGYPVVLKAVADEIAHKTELGLVAVGLANDDDLARAFAQLSERLGRLDPPLADGAFLVQEFLADGVEVFAGVARDPDFGLSLAFGIGGTAIDVVRDFALRMLPLREGDAEAMIAETRGAALLGEFRGRPAADVARLAAALEALADFAWQNADHIDEIDLNPIMALPKGRGCVVVDALIVTRAEA